jgi:hypothetical protein
VIKNIENFSPKLEFTGFSYLEMSQQGHVDVHTARVIQKVPARVSEGKAARSDEVGGIAYEWPNASRIAGWW